VIAYDPSAYGGSAPPVTTPPAIAGTLLSYGSTQGGALTIEVPSVLITLNPSVGVAFSPTAAVMFNRGLALKLG
jgi:hypothetical protein